MVVTSAATFTFTGSGIGNVFAPSFSDNATGSMNTSVVKSGTGSWTLSGTNPYSGGTTVASGSLRALPVSLGSGGPISVSDASALSIFGLTPASTTISASTLTLGTTTGATLGIGLTFAASPNPVFTVGSTNGLTLNGTTTVNLSNAGVQSAGEIPLIAYIGNPIASGLVLGSLPGPRVAAAIDYSTSGLIQINVTSTGAIKWTGVVNSTWDTGTVINQVGNGTFNWQINASATNFVTNDAVIFDDTANGAGAVAVTIPLAVSPTSATFANTNRAYTIAGAAIAGAGPVVVSGGGTVTLATPNTYSGGTFLSAGQLNINSGGTSSTNSSIGTGPLTIGNGTTIDNTSGSIVTLATNNGRIGMEALHSWAATPLIWALAQSVSVAA